MSGPEWHIDPRYAHMIKVNAIRCDNCHTVIESKHRHDFRSCPCKRVYVDGGLDYQRIGFEPEGPGFTIMTNADDGTWIELLPAEGIEG